MKMLSAFGFAILLLAAMSTEASAWYCRAVGPGRSGWARYDSRRMAIDRALFQCEKTGVMCRIQYCVP